MESDSYVVDRYPRVGAKVEARANGGPKYLLGTVVACSREGLFSIRYENEDVGKKLGLVRVRGI
jgi:hypothetical protein